MFSDREFGSNTRRNVLLAMAGMLFVIFIGRLVQLQLVEGSQYRSKSEAQGIKQIPVEPVRGAMFDRNGKVVVANVPSFAVYVTPKKLTADVKLRLARILGTDTNKINEQIKAYKVNDFSPVRIWRDVDRQAWAYLNELHSDLPGVDIMEESKRMYPPDMHASHLLGYTREINEDQLTRLGDYYIPGDVVGQSGVEEKFEAFLRGKKGYEFVAVNNRGQRVGRFNDGKTDVVPGNGFDLYLGLDAGLQQYAEQLLQGKRGAVVAIDPSNGEILAMASAPDYDPRIFSGSSNREEMNKVYRDPANPLFNRASQTNYPPGSTWKMLMGIAGLMEGIITPKSVISCGGSFTLGNKTWKCHGAHGAVNVQRAIHVSCNVFFYKLAMQLGIERYTKYGKMFHFGDKQGADILEASGLLPSLAYYEKRFGKGKMPKAAIVNLGIGQGELGVNPLQLASYCATLANGGTFHTPHVVRAVKNKELNNEIEKVKYDSEDLGIPKEYIDVIRAGMFDCVNTPGGTGAAARMDSITVAGKTGTAQAGKGKLDHAWFVSFAPFDRPRIALCVLVENSGFGGTHSAPIARKLIRFYLTRQKEAEDRNGGPSPSLMNDALPSIQETGDVQESSMMPDSVDR
jgi:penicillin-binding protein 2